MATLENASVPRKRLTTYGKAARRRIPDYGFNSLAHRSQTPEIKQTELLPSRSASVTPVQESKKLKNATRGPTSIPPSSPTAGADIFEVPSSDDEARDIPRPAFKATKKPIQHHIPEINMETLAVRKEDSECRKRVKLSPIRPAVRKPSPIKGVSKPSPLRTKVHPVKQRSMEEGHTTTVVARPKPALQKRLAQVRAPRKLSPVLKSTPPVSTPSPGSNHFDMMDVDISNNFISPRGQQMWKDLLEPVENEGDMPAMDQPIDRTDVATAMARIAGKTLFKAAGVSKPSHKSPRKLPRRRLIDSLVEQATYYEDLEEGDSDSHESDTVVETELARIISRPISRSQSLVSEVPNPSLLSSSQSQSQLSQNIGPKFTYSKQRSMLAEEDFLKQLEFDMPSQPVQPTLGKKSRRGSIPILQKIQNFHEEEENDDSMVGIRSVHELRQAGANNRFLDEIEDLLDLIGSPTNPPSSMRRSGLLDLASKIKDKNFTRQFRSNGVDQRLFVHMGRETDLIAGLIMVSILTVLIADVSILPHVVTQLRTQGIARLLIRLLESESSFTLLGKDRKNNMSKVAQSLLSEHADYLLELPIWEDLKPKVISPRMVAIKSLELMIRQTRETGNSGDLISKELTSKLFSILKSASDESAWELPSGRAAINFYLALSALESHSIAARTLQDETIWISDYLPIIADTLESALAQPIESFGVLQSLILRLTLNVTNNNPRASDIFSRKSLMVVMGKVVVSKFKKVARFLTEEDLSVVVDHLILILGVMTNFFDSSSAARNSLQSSQGTLDDPLDDMTQLYVDNKERTSMAESVEESYKNVAFGYLSVVLGYLCLSPIILERIRNKQPAKTIRPLIASIEEFIVHHKTADDLLDAEDGHNANKGLTERLESLVSKLKTMKVGGK